MKAWIDHLFWKRTWFRLWCVCIPTPCIPVWWATAVITGNFEYGRTAALLTCGALWVLGLADNNNMDGVDHPLDPRKKAVK